MDLYQQIDALISSNAQTSGQRQDASGNRSTDNYSILQTILRQSNRQAGAPRTNSAPGVPQDLNAQVQQQILSSIVESRQAAT